jgi:uncharacterized protein
MTATWCSVRGNDVLLRLRIQPRSSREGTDGVHGDRLRVRVSAPPVEGAANARLLEVLAKALDVPRSALRLTHGERGRDKEVLIAGAAARLAHISAKLCPGTV